MRLALFLTLLLLILQVAEGEDRPLKEVPASEILANISKGLPVEYDHVIVIGDLSLSNLKDLPSRQIKYLGIPKDVKIVASPIRINDSVINGIVNFNSIILEGTTDFEGSNFYGPAIFEVSNFNGSADFGGSNFNSYANFWDSRFNGSADFGASNFNGSADFGSSSFNGSVDFEKSNFNGSANFGSSSFNGSVDFDVSNFNSDSVFWGSTFNNTAYFRGSNFSSYADFGSSSFNGSVEFVGSNFKSDSDFRGSNFNSDSDFGGSNFNSYADFRDSTFNNSISFWNSTFNSDANFMNSNFNGSTDFNDSTFKSYAYFSGSKFNNSTEFAKVIFQKETSFSDSQFRRDTSFNSSQFKEDALFEGADFNCTLYLTRTKYDKLYIRWRDIKDLAYDDAAYLSLMENFKKLGYLEDYDNCYYEYRKEHRDQDWQGKYHTMLLGEEIIRKKIDRLLEVSYGYGKKPLYPLYWSAIIVVFFTVFWMWVPSKKRDRKLHDYAIENDLPPRGGFNKSKLQRYINAFLDALSFSITVFLSGTRLFIDPPEVPGAGRLPQSMIKKVFLLERLLGAFFSILFFLAIGATIVR